MELSYESEDEFGVLYDESNIDVDIVIDKNIYVDEPFAKLDHILANGADNISTNIPNDEDSDKDHSVTKIIQQHQ